MTTPRQPTDPDAEREVDLGRWRSAVVHRWWLPLGGLVVGAIVGVVVALGGGGTYKATALISLGQPTSPGGGLVNGYGTNPLAISQIVSSASAQSQAAKRAGMQASALRDHVSIAQVGTPTGAGATRATPLIALTVTGAHPETAAGAANALADIVVQKTTGPYVALKVRAFKRTLGNVDVEISTVNRRIAVIEDSIAASKHLEPLQQLVIVSQEDNAESRFGALISQQNTLQEELAFAGQVESAQVVTRAEAVKASAHSRGTSAVIGALVGLILGAIGAIVADGRMRAS